MNDLLVKLLEGVKTQDPVKLVVTLDMLLSAASFVEKLILTMSEEMSDKEVKEELEKMDARYEEQKRRMKENIARAKQG